MFSKKLITNFEEITTYNFYNPNNVFRLSYDKIDGLKNFLEKTYEPIDDDIRKEYVAANWLNSFFRTSNINNITNSSLEQGL